jgi:molybdopterin converting factor small subunit
MKRSIELYGRLKDAGRGGSVELELGADATAAEALRAVGAALGDPRLIEGAALATETEVLAASGPVPSSGRLAVLPPVCGG